MLLGVGKDAELRRILTSASRNFTEHALTFDWLGDYAFVGVADRSDAVDARAVDQAVLQGQDEIAAQENPVFHRRALGVGLDVGLAVELAA